MSKLKEKGLCKLVKEDALEKALKDFKKLVENPTHICTKCGRVANDKTFLCKPEKLD